MAVAGDGPASDFFHSSRPGAVAKDRSWGARSWEELARDSTTSYGDSYGAKSTNKVGAYLHLQYYFYTILALLSGAHPGQSTISGHPSVSLGMLQVNLLPFPGIVPSYATRLYPRPETTMFADV